MKINYKCKSKTSISNVTKKYFTQVMCLLFV